MQSISTAAGLFIRTLALSQLDIALAFERADGVAIGGEGARADRSGRSDIGSKTRLAVPEIEPPVRVYDSSGPYTEDAAQISVERGLPRSRETWVRGRGVEAYQGRDVRPEDNGNAGKSLAREFPVRNQPRRGLDGHPITQLELARAGVITEEITQQVRDYAAKLEEKQQGMDEMSEKFKEMGGEVYVKS